MNKYRAKKTIVDGIKFDSMHEAARYLQLKKREEEHDIRDLQLQVPFELIPVQRDAKGRITERAVKYIADFVYFNSDGNLVVEDAKGLRTDAYKLKRKMMLYFKGIRIEEV